MDGQDDEDGLPRMETDATSVEDFVNKILREDSKVHYIFCIRALHYTYALCNARVRVLLCNVTIFFFCTGAQVAADEHNARRAHRLRPKGGHRGVERGDRQIASPLSG